MYTIKEAFPVEDGALHGPSGRYFLPVVSTGEGKKMTVTGAVILGLCAAIVTAIALLGSNWLSKDYSEALNDYADYLGEQKAQVLQALEVDDEELTALNASGYVVPEQIKLYNMDFDLILYFDDATQALRGYGYRTQYQADAQAAAKQVAEFVNKLGYKKSDGSVLILEESDLLEGFLRKEEFHLNQSWNLTPGENTTGPVSKYLKQMENSEDWSGRVAGFLAIPAAWYRDLDVSYDPHKQILTIQLNYGAEARRTGVVGKR